MTKGRFSAALSLSSNRYSEAITPPRLRAARFRLLLGLEVFAGGLVDHLHRQARLAAVVEAEQLTLTLSPSLTTSEVFCTRFAAKLRNMHEAVLGAEEVHEGAETPSP